MKIKTNELSGSYLDYAVAMAEGLKAYHIIERDYGQSGVRILDVYCVINLTPAGHTVYSPSLDWSIAGPIIERERICTGWSALWGCWIARDLRNAAISPAGPTPLIAAMRCYVASRLGDEVEVPLPT